MKSICLKRVGFTEDHTSGVLLDGNIAFAVTHELPWKNNDRDVSCIPPGVRTAFRYKSPKFGDTFMIPVEGREGILFHKGNVALEDSLGCILIGEQFEPIDGKFGIWHSGKGFKEFMDRLNGHNEFQFTVLAL
jgi:hypothetical protein